MEIFCEDSYGSDRNKAMNKEQGAKSKEERCREMRLELFS
jgi:hypothetical protein